jgi:outer membrane protein OmpA-like peptidoglycan-associated protein
MAIEKGSSALDSSLTDLMTSLAVIFILLLVASLNNAQQEGIDTRNNILIELQRSLKEFIPQGVQVENDPKDPLSLMVLVPEALFGFEVNKSQLPARGEEFLEAFAPRLFATACSERFRLEINSIVVEGHSDSTGSESRNLPLSQERSMEVAQKSLNDLEVSAENRNRDLHGCALSLISASGRGSADPVLVDGIEDKGKSRRVIFKIRVRSIEQKTLVEVLRGTGHK